VSNAELDIDRRATSRLRRVSQGAKNLTHACSALPAQLKQMLLEPKMEHPEVMITGHTQNLPKVTAYFEKESGMLARLVYFIDTSFGQYPTQIEYSDFRDVGGRKVPYAWVFSQTRNRKFTWAMQNVRAVAVEDSKFARPAAAVR
jgi:hypothetical protein